MTFNGIVKILIKHSYSKGDIVVKFKPGYCGRVFIYLPSEPSPELIEALDWERPAGMVYHFWKMSFLRRIFKKGFSHVEQ